MDANFWRTDRWQTNLKSRHTSSRFAAGAPAKYGLQYEDKDIINDPANYAEMVQKSGQPLSPCVVVDGQMLADVSGEEIEAWMLQNGVVNPVNA